MPLLAPLAYACLSRAELVSGDLDRAVSTAETGRALLDEVDRVEEGEAAARLAHAEALRARGRFADASASIEEARTRILERAGRISDPAWRKSFLEAIPDHARTLALAASWANEQPPREA